MDAVPGARLLVHAGTAIARLEESRVRFVDEFRDAELGRALAGEILATVEPGRHYKVMEVCGGPHALDLQVRHRRPAPGERRAGARPRAVPSA